jgi:hypothetical protein
MTGRSIRRGDPTRTCSVPTCEAAPVLQWQRRASEAETAAYLAGLAEKAEQGLAYQRVQHQMRIAELTHLQANLPATKDGAIVRRMADEGMAEATAALAAVPAGEPSLDHHLPVTVAVFGCEEHGVMSRPGMVHAERCCTAGPCDCE